MSDITTRTVRRVDVSFTGSRAGSAELTWGQFEIWAMLQRRRRPGGSNLFRLLRLPAGYDVAAVADAVRRLVERYEALRTTVRCASDGVPRQHVAASGVLPLLIFDSEPTGVDAFAEQVLSHCMPRDLDGDEGPFLPAVVTVQGSATYLILVISHLAVDREAADHLGEVVLRLLTGADDDGQTVWQPLDQAAAEASPRAALIRHRAEKYWYDALARAPLTLLPVDPDANRNVWSVVELRSRALATAAGLLAARHSTSPPAVVLAALSAVLAARAGDSRVVMYLVSNNRFDPRMRDMVCSCAQPGLFVVDVGDADFGAAVERTREAMMLAYRYAYVPPWGLYGVFDRLAEERGARVEVGGMFQCTTPRGAPAPPPARPPVEELVAQVRQRTVRGSAQWPQELPVTMDLAESPEGMALTLTADPAMLDRRAAEAVLIATETLLVRAVQEHVRMREIPELVARALDEPRRPSGGPGNA